MPSLRWSLPALLLLLPLLALLPAPAAAIDESDLLPIEQAFRPQAVAEARDRITVSFAIADGYYLYRHRMGVESADAGFDVLGIELPDGMAQTDEFFGDTEIYRDRMRFTVRGAAQPDLRQTQLVVRFQGCADIGVCYPPHRTALTVALPAAAAVPAGLPLGGGARTPFSLAPSPAVGVSDAAPLPPEQAFGFEAIAGGHDHLLLRFTPAPGYYLYRDRNAFGLVDSGEVELEEPQWPRARDHHDDHFGAVQVYFDPVEVRLPVARLSAAATDVTLEATFQGCQTDGICYPPMTRRVQVALPGLPAGETPVSARTPIERTTPPERSFGAGAVALALLLAIGGGLILNLMPCVLPVLSLKALSLADHAHAPAQARRSALVYTAGVLVSFAVVGLVVIALRQAGLALGWGFQLQQPWVVGLLAYVMFAVGLSLSGVFQIGAGLAGLGQGLTERGGASGDFFTGVLAVVVASPCTAPLMGTALAFAFAAPAALSLMVFLALGLGLALPFLLIGFVPALASRLPRPGAWMVAFKQVMAFPMYLTAVWLVWVLAKQRGADAIGLWGIGAVLLAAALWGFERQRWRPRLAAIALCLFAAIGAMAALPAIQRLPVAAASTSADGSVPYSAPVLAALRGEGRVVFVNMTADWCVTCKANEARVLAGSGFAAALAAADAVYMKGDWTNVDPEITRFLEAHGAVGVPLYVVFPSDGGPGRVLPIVLTTELVRDALAGARR